MKKLLLTTSILVASTLSVQAEISMTGKAMIGILSEGDGTGHNYGKFGSDAKIALKFSGKEVTDDGMEYGGSFTLESGNLAKSGTFSSTTGKIKDPSIYVKGAFGKLYAKENDDDEAVIGYKGTFGSTTIGAENNFADDVAKFTVKQVISNGFYVAGKVETDHDWEVAAGYEADTYSFELAYDNDDVTTATIGVEYEGFTAEIEADTADEWEATIGYEAGKFGLSLAYDWEKDYEIEVTYTLKENLYAYLTAELETEVGDEEDEITLGVAFTF